METLNLLIPLAVAIVMSIPGIVALILQRRKTGAEADRLEAESKKFEAETDKLKSESAEIIKKASLELTMEYKKKAEELEGIVAELEKKIISLQGELKVAHAEIKRLTSALEAFELKQKEG